MSVFKRHNSKYYWCKFQYKGTEYRESTGATSKTEAQEFERKFRARLKEQHLHGTQRQSFNGALARFITEHVEHKKLQTANRYLGSCRILKDHFSHQYVDEISRKNVQDFISSRKRDGVGGSGITHDVAVLRKMLSLCVGWGYAPYNVAADLDTSTIPKKKERVRSLTVREETALLKQLSPEYADITMVALETGMRLGEILALRRTNLDYDNREIMVERSGPEEQTTKSHRPRVVPMSIAAEKIFRRQPVHLRCTLVFPVVGTDALGMPSYSARAVSGFSSWFGKRVKKAKINDFRFHDTRHTFATRYLKNRGRIERLQQILGHSTINQTMKYAHIATDDLHDDMKRVERRKKQAAKRAK